MALLRPTVILLACLALLASAGSARAASRLTATPPVPLPSSTAGVTAPATGTESSSASAALPRTGDDLPVQLVLAAALVFTGGLLRVRASRIE